VGGIGRGVVVCVRGVLGAEVVAGFPALGGEDAVAVVVCGSGPGGVVGVVGELFASAVLSVMSLWYR